MPGQDIIKVATADLQEAITKFDRCKDKFAIAYGKMSTEVAILDASWNGEASQAFANRYAELANNLQTSDETIAQAVAGLRTACSMYEDLQEQASSVLEAMTDAPDSPFGG